MSVVRFFAGVFVVLLGFSAWAAAANSTVLGGGLSLNALRYVPYPAEPGQYVDLWTEVLASDAQSDVSCRLLPAFPFSLDPSESAERTLPQLPGRQSWLLKYRVRVDPAAVLGDNALQFGCRAGNSPFLSANFSVFVQPQSADLALDSVVSAPEKMAPGQGASVRLLLRNHGGSDFKNVRVALDLSDPFVPLKGGLEKRLDRIPAGLSAAVQFDVLAAASAQSGGYRVPVHVSFQDAAGTAYVFSDVIGLQVGAQPQLDVQLLESNLLRPDSLGNLTIKLVNRGPSEVKFLNVRLLDSGQYSFAGPSAQYVGSVASDDSETADFTLYAKASHPSLLLHLDFRDAQNAPYAEDVRISVPTYSEDEISRFRLESKPGVDWWMLVVVLALIGYAANWAWGRWGRRK